MFRFLKRVIGANMVVRNWVLPNILAMKGLLTMYTWSLSLVIRTNTQILQRKLKRNTKKP